MSVNLDPCFQYIFGLSQTECDCPEFADRPDDYSQSDSGNYLDQLDGLSLTLILEGASCEKGNIWDMMARAREIGVKQMKIDLLGCISQNSILRRDPVKGIIGNFKKFSKDLNQTTTYSGLRIRIPDIRGGFAIIRRIGMLFNATSSKALKLYDTYGNELADLGSIPTVINQIAWYSIPYGGIPINLDDYAENYSDFNLVYAVNGVKPKDMKIAADCCGTKYIPSWNEAHPTYTVQGAKPNNAWAFWSMAAGIKGNDLSTIETWATEFYANGIAVDIEFGCRDAQTICNGKVDYVNDALGAAMSMAAMYRAGSILVKSILSSANPRLYSTMPPELLAALAKDYDALYLKRIEWLCKEWSDEKNINQNSDCRACHSKNFQFDKVTLLK